MLLRVLVCVLAVWRSRAMHVLAPAEEPPARPAPSLTARQKEPCLLADEVPTPTRACAARKQPLIIVSGEGKTGTESLATSLAMLGLKVAHFDSLVQCCHVVYTNPGVRNTSIDGIDTGLPGKGAYPVCETTPRYSAETCSDISWDIDYRPYYSLIQQIDAMPLEQYDDFDWCQFDDYDVISDVPVAYLAPYVYRAYGKGTKVINTVRNVTQWTKRRADWDKTQGLNDTAPMGWLFEHNVANGALPWKPTSAIGLYSRSQSADAFAYIAERSLIRCTVEPDDYLELNLVDNRIDPPALWGQISGFLQLPTKGLNTSVFPHEVPGTCHSANTRATYRLIANATYDPGGQKTPFSYKQYEVFNYFPESFEFAGNLEGCASTVRGGKDMPVEETLDEKWRSIFFNNAKGVVEANDPSCLADWDSACDEKAEQAAAGAFENILASSQSSTSTSTSTSTSATQRGNAALTEVLVSETTLGVLADMRAAYQYGTYFLKGVNGTTGTNTVNEEGVIPKSLLKPVKDLPNRERG